MSSEIIQLLNEVKAFEPLCGAADAEAALGRYASDALETYPRGPVAFIANWLAEQRESRTQLA
jgi:hypothetical protein